MITLVRIVPYTMNNLKALNDKMKAQEVHETEQTENLQERGPIYSAYRTAEERGAILTAIVDSSDDAIVSKDLQGIITSWNKSAERIFGYTASEMIGASILTLIPEDRQEEEVTILAQLRKGQRVDHFETRRRKKDGRLIDVSLTISPVKNAAGQIIGLSKIARDITDRKLEQQRRNDFVAILSHELKTPLTSLKSYIQMALARIRNSSDQIGMDLLNRAELQTRKMTTMISDFLNLSRLEEGKMTLSLNRFSLAELMEEVISDALVLAPEHLLIYTGCPELKIHADRDKLAHVMINLLNNAVKYSDTGTTITVACKVSTDTEAVEISFSDQGIGISHNDQKRLFERFYRVENDKSKASGFGIGLYLVAEILKLHGSSINLISSPGQGATFSFSLPVS